MGIEDLSVKKLRKLSESPVELRQYCISEGLNLIDVIGKLPDLIEQKSRGSVRSETSTPNVSRSRTSTSRRVTRRRTRRATPEKDSSEYTSPEEVESAVDSVSPTDKEELRRIGPDGIAQRIVRELRDSGSGVGYESLSALAVLADIDFRDAGAGYELNCPPEGFIADYLYRTVHEAKFGVGGSPVRQIIEEGDIGRRIRLTFGNTAKNHILGILDPDYVAKHYIHKDGSIHYIDSETGEVKPRANIEGTRCWDCESKEKVRIELSNFNNKYLISDLEKTIKKIVEEVKGLDARREAAQTRIEEAEEGLEGIRNLGDKVHYTIVGKPYLIDKVIHDALGGRRRRQGLQISESPNKKGKKLEVVFDGRFNGGVDVSNFVKKFRAFQKHHADAVSNGDLEDNVLGLDVIKRSRGRKRDELNVKIKDSRDELKSLDSLETRLESQIQATRGLNYLGLEGPNFGSFLRMQHDVNKSGFRLDGTFIEREMRLNNIMESVIDSGICGDDLAGSYVYHRDIRNWILLDLPIDKEMKIESAPGSSDSEFLGLAKYKGEKLELERYHTMLDDIDSGMSTDKVVEKYNVSSGFVGAAKKRVSGKFDVVFLDYVGRMSNRNIKAAETLIARRLSDRAIVATTTNLNPSFNPRREGGDVEEIPERLNELYTGMAERNGFRSVAETCDHYHNPESGRASKMYFQAYYFVKQDK